MSDFPCPFCKAMIRPLLKTTPAEVTVPAPTLRQGTAEVTGLELVAPPPPAPTPVPTLTQGVKVIAFNAPPEDIAAGTSRYQGTVIGYYAGLLTALAAIQKRGGQVILAVSQKGMRDAAGVLSVAAATATINSYDVTALKPYIGNTIIGPLIADDITDPMWGAISLAERLKRWDEIAGVVAQRFGCRSLIRARRGEFSGYQFKNPVIAWAQYSARKGDVGQFAVDNAGAILGLNVLDGGDGSSKILGTYDGAWQMSGPEIVKYGKALMVDEKTGKARTYVLPCWRIGFNYPDRSPTPYPAAVLAGIRGFDNKPDVVAAFAELQTLGATIFRPALG